MRICFLALCLTLTTPARSETLAEPYGHCDQQTLDEAVAIDRLPGDKSFLRDHLRSYGCRLIYPARRTAAVSTRARRGRDGRSGRQGDLHSQKDPLGANAREESER